MKLRQKAGFSFCFNLMRPPRGRAARTHHFFRAARVRLTTAARCPVTATAGCVSAGVATGVAATGVATPCVLFVHVRT